MPLFQFTRPYLGRFGQFVPQQGEVSLPPHAAGTLAARGFGFIVQHHKSVTEFQTVNINTADAGQLRVIEGVGPATAKKIVANRSEHGPFTSADDLKRVSGVADKIVDENRHLIIV